MNKIKSLLSLLLVVAMGVVTACGDDSPGETDQQKKTRQMSKTWVITDVEVGTNDFGDIYDETSPATIEFESSGKFTITDVQALPEIRAPFGPLPAEGTWAFTSTTNFNNVKLSWGTGNELQTSIIDLSDDEIVFSYNGAIDKAQNEVTVTITAVPQ